MRSRSSRLAIFALALLAAPAAAEVKSADEAGFDVGGATSVAAPPQTVWATLIKPSRWWDSAHTWSGKAANLSIVPRAGGCFCERLAGGGSVEHMRVIRTEPGKLLVLSGGLGPLQSEPIGGVLTVMLERKEGQTIVTWRYVVSGLRAAKGAAIAGPVENVLSAQFASLARSATGRAGTAPQPR